MWWAFWVSNMINKILKISLVLGAITISISFAYYFLYFLPSKERLKNESQENMKIALNICLSKAEQDKTEGIDGIPEIIDVFKDGFAKQGFGVPTDIQIMNVYSARMEWVNKKFNSDQNYCFKLYN